MLSKDVQRKIGLFWLAVDPFPPSSSAGTFLFYCACANFFVTKVHLLSASSWGSRIKRRNLVRKCSKNVNCVSDKTLVRRNTNSNLKSY